jgi:hypothetical protein
MAPATATPGQSIQIVASSTAGLHTTGDRLAAECSPNGTAVCSTSAARPERAVKPRSLPRPVPPCPANLGAGNHTSESELAQAGMVIWAPSQGPVIHTL